MLLSVKTLLACTQRGVRLTPYASYPFSPLMPCKQPDSLFSGLFILHFFLTSLAKCAFWEVSFLMGI
jgi:hypothetical protein